MTCSPKILFAVENQQEFSELVVLVRELLSGYQDQRQFILFRTHPLFKLDDYGGKFQPLFSEIYTARNPFNRNFKQVSIFKKIVLIIINSVILFRISRRHKITHILSGVPLIFHRVIKLLFPSVIHIVYIRGLLLFSEKVTSVSDRFFFMANKIKTLRFIRFFNNYYADYLFTIGVVNKNTLLKRKIPESNIFISGPLLLDRYPSLEHKHESAPLKKELIYITQSYLWHLDTFGHTEQLKTIRSLLDSVSKSSAGQFDTTIRVHPRDDKRLYEKLLLEYFIPVRIDTSPASEFLQEISGSKFLVSGLSTLAFEWIYLGGYCFFLSTENLLKENREFYDRLGISPYLDTHKILQDVLSNQIPNYRGQIDRIFYRHPSTNLKYAVDAINAAITHQPCK